MFIKQKRRKNEKWDKKIQWMNKWPYRSWKIFVIPKIMIQKMLYKKCDTTNEILKNVILKMVHKIVIKPYMIAHPILGLRMNLVNTTNLQLKTTLKIETHKT